MTIWKNKKELPDFDREFLEVYKDNSKNIEEFVSENKAREYYLSTPDAIMPSFTVYRELDDVVVKWCYLDDLLSLEQQLQEKSEKIKELDSNIITLLNALNRKDEEKEELENVLKLRGDVIKNQEQQLQAKNKGIESPRKTRDN